MSTRRHGGLRKNRTTKNRKMTGHGKTGKKWVTAIAAAHKTLRTTGSLTAAKKSLKSQALYNARKLFGSI
jgi:hypothetical protein